MTDHDCTDCFIEWCEFQMARWHDHVAGMARLVIERATAEDTPEIEDLLEALQAMREFA